MGKSSADIATGMTNTGALSRDKSETETSWKTVIFIN
jgi:hypothetical protein